MWLVDATLDSASIDCFQFFLCICRASSSEMQPTHCATSTVHMHPYPCVCPHGGFIVLLKPGWKEWEQGPFMGSFLHLGNTY